MKVVKVSMQRPDPKIIAEAARIIRNGGLVIFPTETVYGLGADAFNARAVAKIFKAKGRPEGKPLIVHVAKKSTIAELAQGIPSIARKLVRAFWPGPLTLVLSARARLPKLVTGLSAQSAIVPSMALSAQVGKMGKTGKREAARTVAARTVAVRMPDHAVARALIMASGPIAAPSANFSGEPPPRSIKEIPQALLEKVDLILDAGPTRVKVPSTVLDLTTQPPVILRKGAISGVKLKRAGLSLKP